MTYGSGVAVCHMTKYGLGRHIYVMDVQNIPLYLRVSILLPLNDCSRLLTP
jgi:hypothetical protein